MLSVDAFDGKMSNMSLMSSFCHESCSVAFFKLLKNGVRHRFSVNHDTHFIKALRFFICIFKLIYIQPYKVSCFGYSLRHKKLYWWRSRITRMLPNFTSWVFYFQKPVFQFPTSMLYFLSALACFWSLFHLEAQVMWVLMRQLQVFSEDGCLVLIDTSTLKISIKLSLQWIFYDRGIKTIRIYLSEKC